MMMMMIFICVQRNAGETRVPETSRRVWGRAKLWDYVQCMTVESSSCIAAP
jgi:hypothetical protein